ncbi:winged helix-turn-helix transcriptional regulator [Micromonospora sp. DT229]|uniref:winged helix-turn-helix transcriptional regulator n=1 Tax=Micromonospora sp. DT229 TaxID=3393430 RepID=UPI003CF28913
MARRTYGQYCGLARALEFVGERWAMLIIRDLLVGPRRFTDLQRLPRIPTNVLSARLREMEANGLIRRRVVPRPASGVVYELTDYGAQLEPILLSLGAWGARALRDPTEGEVITPDSLVIALRATFQPHAAPPRLVSFELRCGPAVVHCVVDHGELAVTDVGPLPGADAVIETGPALRRLMAGEVAPEQALADGLVRVCGDAELLDRFVEMFHIDSLPVSQGVLEQARAGAATVHAG